MTRLWMILVAMVCGCAPKAEETSTDTDAGAEADSDGNTDTDSDSGTDSGSSEPLECSKYFDDDDEYEKQQWDCDLKTLCDTVSYDDGKSAFHSRATAECMLQAFAERQPGKLTLDYQDSDITSSWTQTMFILDTEGHVAKHGVSYSDMITSYSINRPYLLQSPSYFEGCLKADSDQEMLECLFGWRDGECVDIETTCDGGF